MADLSRSLRAAYQQAQEALDAELAAIEANPARYARVSRLRELQRSVQTMTDQLDEQARDWFSTQFPTAYAIGAQSVGEFAWTQADRFAVTQLAQDSFDDLLAATQHVDDTTKALVRALGKNAALLKETTGRTATDAGKRLAKLLESKGVGTITYANGAKHGIGEYSDMLLRSVSATAHNLGTLNFGKRSGVKYYEIADSFDCGMFGHDDPDKPNRSVRSAEECMAATTSHPRCVRGLLPRGDVSTPQEAKEAESLISDEAQADQDAQVKARRQGVQAKAETNQRRAQSRRKVEARKAQSQARVDARAQRTGVQGDLGLDRIGTLPKPSTLPHDADGLTPTQLEAARRDLPRLKANVRATAAKVQGDARTALESLDIAEMAPPVRTGPGSELYEWYYRLNPQEQQRLRNTWMKGNRQVANPDLIADRISEAYGPGDFDDQMMRWVEETRRADAGGLLARGKQPIPGRYGDLDIDGIFGDGTFHVSDLFDSDPTKAVRSVATTTQSQAQEFAARAFVKPKDGRLSPYEMDEDAYVREFTAMEQRMADAKPIRSDPEFGDEFSAEDNAVLERMYELLPEGVDDEGLLSADQIYRRIVELAVEAGLR